ncbi:MAG: radical SAM family heme chaperone HemW [Nitrospirae bacterium YQR-1]
METKESYIYIHIPFCLKKCRYCDFYSIPYSTGLETAYVSALLREIQMRRSEISKIRTLYFGGGTPTVMSKGSFSAIMSTLYDNFDFHPDSEITVEANPVTLKHSAHGMTEWLRLSGVNRISLGVQSFNDKILKSLGRLHSGNEAREAMRELKDIYSNVSLDLMYAIPGQSVGMWKDTVYEALSFNPTHISAYELTPEEHTPLWAELRAGDVSLLDEETIIEMYEFLTETLTATGFDHYEISNYALKERQCLHNLNYWSRGLYTGLGAAAHSHVAINGCCLTTRYSNAANVRTYTESVNNGTLPVEEKYIVTGGQAQMERIFLGLRMCYGVRFDKIPAEAAELISAGLIETDGRVIKLTEKGFLLSNYVIGQLSEQGFSHPALEQASPLVIPSCSCCSTKNYNLASFNVFLHEQP